MSISNLEVEYDKRRERFVVWCDYNSRRYNVVFSCATLREFALCFLARRKPRAKDIIGALNETFRQSHELRQREGIARFVTWAWRAVRVYCADIEGPRGRLKRLVQESLLRKESQWQRARRGLEEKLEGLIPISTAFEVQFSDRGIVFTLHPRSELRWQIIFPTVPEEFVHPFRLWWQAAEEDMRIIVEDLWKHLHGTNDGLSLPLKYELATCFITALSQEEFRHLRKEQDISWHYCYWHKLRWQVAKQLSDEAKLERAAVDWLEVCYSTEPTEPAIGAEIDPEKEIREVVFSEDPSRSTRGNIPSFLQRREREKQTLFRLAQWFMRRYDLSGAFRIVGGSYRWLTIALWAVIFLSSYLYAAGVLTYISPFLPAISGLFLFLLLFRSLYNAERAARLIGRLFGGCIIGWLPLFTQEAWQFSLLNPQSNMWLHILPPLLLFIVVGYIYLEGRRFLSAVSRREIIWRSMKVLFLGLAISVLIGLTLIKFGAFAILPTVIKDGVIPGCPAPLLGLLRIRGIYGSMEDPSTVFPLAILVVQAPLALFIGVFIQILWEEKPMTEPL